MARVAYMNGFVSVLITTKWTEPETESELIKAYIEQAVAVRSDAPHPRVAGEWRSGCG